MKLTKILTFALVLALLLSLCACSSSHKQSDLSKRALSPQPTGQAYLYGEQHGVKEILDGELELWYEYYHNEDMRHLYIEYPYYTAQFLNLWMQSDNNEILDTVYEDWAGTLAQNPNIKEFFKQIKLQCPETIFYGTDVGHCYNTTGERFLKMLKDNNQEDSEQYERAEEVIKQGKYYYDHEDEIYRENKMVENFIYEFGKLSGENVMGIYGAAHIRQTMNSTQSVAIMANQLKKHYGDSVHLEDLSKIAIVIEPEKTDAIVVDGKEYQVSYFGKKNLIGFKDYAYREFWRLENAYDDFVSKPKSGNVLPCDNYPMLIESGQIFVIDYVKTDGAVAREYHLFEGQIWEGRLATEELIIE